MIRAQNCPPVQFQSLPLLPPHLYPQFWPQVTSNLIFLPSKILLSLPIFELYINIVTQYITFCVQLLLFLIIFVLHPCSCFSVPFWDQSLDQYHTVLITIALCYIFTSNGNKAIVINTALFFRIALALNSFPSLLISTKILVGFFKIRITLKLSANLVRIVLFTIASLPNEIALYFWIMCNFFQ